MSNKKVTFGEISIIEVADVSKFFSWPSSFIEHLIRYLGRVSFVRDLYYEKRELERLSDLIIEIAKHDDVYQVDIFIQEGITDRFILDLVDLTNNIFKHFNKISSIVVSDKTLFCFYDGYSNPSMDDNFFIKERWEE